MNRRKEQQQQLRFTKVPASITGIWKGKKRTAAAGDRPLRKEWIGIVTTDPYYDGCCFVDQIYIGRVLPLLIDSDDERMLALCFNVRK